MGERWSADELEFTCFKVLFGVVVWVVRSLVPKMWWASGVFSPPVGALCVSTCVSNMLLAAALRLVLFSFCAFMHHVVVSERDISAFVMCVGVFCITMTR